MAYTYDNFVTAATGAGLMDKFTDDDLNIAKNNPEYGLSMVKLQQDLQGSTTTEQKLLAQEAMNQLRKSYGSFGGTPATVAGPTGSFTYGNQNAYQKALEAVTNPGSFSYDMTQDPTYSAMKKSYLREGDRSRADTMAQVSAATGGTPSSYAVTAAQQAGDYYSEKLADQIPTLEQNAYQRYLARITQQQAQLEALQADRAFDYNLYLQNYEQEQQKYANALALYQMLGYATPEVAKILGISTPKAQTTETGTKRYRNPSPKVEDEEEEEEETPVDDGTLVDEGTGDKITYADVGKRAAEMKAAGQDTNEYLAAAKAAGVINSSQYKSLKYTFGY